MGKEDIEIMVAENQMSFDFSQIENEEKEESAIFTQTFIKAKNYDWIKDEVLFVAVKANHYDIAKDFSNLNLCGKKMLDWVLMAGSDCESKIINDSDDIFASIRSLATSKPIIAVFYSDTPLLDKITFNKICDYFSSRNMNFLQLSRGFVIKTEYIKNNRYFAQGVNLYEDKNLLVADSAKMISQISNLLYNKITAFHQKNGVVIYGQNTVFIDADVEIEGGVIIYPNNVIQGQSIIGQGVILQSGNIIKDSIITSGCTLNACFVENSKITSTSAIEPFSKIINEEI